ncbi:hypothetical protein E5357_06175 [Hominisplanchenecus murintestinalis]|uniref:Uncharacterized protein n=1 Tax=Hominisplanchenecus murintestinalis TaxID=2941517 RepID=A0AC61R0D7_9FIRM|nr:hypothetical protein [Hominisplanchenecus murintestinalis]TGX99194.1 hypothetical protein E5357_06175 [Hominisplanchenecus murintestinalis]
MPTPTKPVKVLAMEKRSHRTKKELAQRKSAEESLLTGKILKEKKEVRENPVAHKEFKRLKTLLKAIEKDDDLYGETINRYCLLVAECEDFQQKRERIYQQLCSFQEEMSTLVANEEMTWKEAYYLEDSMQRNILAIDRQVQTKRKMLLDMEKENIMTIASSLRSIPKKVEKKSNPLREALGG